MTRSLLHVFPTFATGGAQVRFASVINRFGRRWRHSIIAMDGNTSCRERLDPNLDVTFPAVSLPKNDTLGNARRCRALLRSMAPDLLVTTNWGALEWALGNLLPIVPHVHIEEGLGPDEVGGQHARRVWLRRLILRRSRVVVPSHGLVRMARDIWWVPQRRLRLILNGVDLHRFDIPASQPHNEPVIGIVAALREEKNVARLLQAFSIVRQALPARLVIVGNGPERPKLEALTQELGIADAVCFAGHTSLPEREYASFDVFALCSDTEQMPLSVLEAMAARLPVVSTDVGDVRLMVAPENHKFIVPKDAAPLADALLELLRSLDLCKRVGAANRARAEQEYDQEAMFEAWASVFDAA